MDSKQASGQEEASERSSIKLWGSEQIINSHNDKRICDDKGNIFDATKGVCFDSSFIRISIH